MNVSAPGNSAPSPGAVAPVSVSLGNRRHETWQVATPWRDRFAMVGPIDWFALAEDPRAEAIKTNPGRQVWRVRFGDAWLYVKQFRVVGWADGLRSLLRGPEALREWRCGVYAALARVPCVSLVACGARRASSGIHESVLITEAAEGAVPLPEAWREVVAVEDPTFRRRALRALNEAVADLLARAHAARFLHRDGHPGNILVRGAGGASPRVMYVDLYGGRIGRAVSDQRAAAGLAQLNQWFSRRAPRSLRLRFLKRYLARRSCQAAVTGAALRRWTELIERAGRRHARRLYAHRDRRLRRDGKYFARLELANGWEATVTLRFRNRDEFPQPTHPDRTVGMWAEWLASAAGRVLDAATVGDRPAGTSLQRWRASGYAQRQSWTLFGSPARRAFAAGHGLRHRDIPCVWPLAVLERRKSGLVSDSVLMLEERPGTSNLAGLLDPPRADHERARRLENQRLRAVVFESLGRLLADATCRGVRWPQPEPSALWVGWPDEADAKPRGLIGRFDGISFLRQPSMRHGAEMVQALVRRLRDCSTVEPQDCRGLVEAYRKRLGSRFRSPDTWLG